MLIFQSIQHTIMARLIDFVLLVGIFYASCKLLSVSYNDNILFYAVLYAIVILVSVQIGKHYMSNHIKSVNSVVKIMLCNATGLVIGVLVMLALARIMPDIEGYLIAIVFASIMAFFVFGTLSPLLKKDQYRKSRQITS